MTLEHWDYLLTFLISVVFIVTIVNSYLSGYERGFRHGCEKTSKAISKMNELNYKNKVMP